MNWWKTRPERPTGPDRNGLYTYWTPPGIHGVVIPNIMPNYFQTIVILFIPAAYTPNTTMLHPFWFFVGVSEAILNAPGYPRGWISEIHSEPCSTVHSLRVDTSHDYNTWLPFFWVRVSDVILDSPGPQGVEYLKYFQNLALLSIP